MSGVLERTSVPLAAVARPAAGRLPTWTVLPGLVQRHGMARGAEQLTTMLETFTGPTRCSPVIVQPAFDEQMARLYLASPVCRHLTTAVGDAILASFRAAPPGSVLLIAHCRVLWRQIRPQVSAQ